MKQSEISTTIRYEWGCKDYIDKNEYPLYVFDKYICNKIKVLRREKISQTYF